eukprot:TRINITY_DN32623_c0_g1_i1.p1 TRINITY_DN32623_c0_g1~~TRINITY_DN32623_c0_g1_i1.p1  ORF type:complete len:532 (+),score=61.87 TRINITY_DN32623_c0_g1_i1:51-1598(+)
MGGPDSQCGDTSVNGVTAKLDVLSINAIPKPNFKLVTSEISKSACPGCEDTNEKYERLMELVDEELARRKDFSSANSEEEERELLAGCPETSVHVVNATRLASDEELLLDGIHTEAFIRSMTERTDSWYERAEPIFVCGSVSAGWSLDTEAAARTGVASLIDCAKDVYAGRYKNGFVLARPPSHHAVGNADLARNGSQQNLPFGFCHLNSIASAVANLRMNRPDLRACIFDFDVHPGNGNEDTFWNDPRVFTISIHQLGIWPGENTCRADYVGGPDALGSVLNFPIPERAHDTEYYHVVREYIFPQIKEFAPDIIFIAAGYDALSGDAYADQELTADWYGWCIAELMTMAIAPLVLNLEGGYTPENVVQAVGRTIDALAGAPPSHFLESMSIQAPSKDATAHNKRMCYERRKSLQEQRAIACSEEEADSFNSQPKANSNDKSILQAATEFKTKVDVDIAALEAEAANLTGKINIKARGKKLKEAKELAKSQMYLDACCVVLGQVPRFGNFTNGET